MCKLNHFYRHFALFLRLFVAFFHFYYLLVDMPFAPKVNPTTNKGQWGWKRKAV